MCIQWIRVLYYVVIKRQSNPPTCAFQNSAERVMNSRVAVQCVQVTLSIYIQYTLITIDTNMTF